MSAKYTIEYVKTAIDKRGGMLLSTEYKDNKAPLEIECKKCNHIWFACFSAIFRNHKPTWCPSCNGGVGITLEVVKKEVERQGFLLQEKCYVNAHTPLKLLCLGCKTIRLQTYSNIQSGQGCMGCRIRRQTYSIDFVRVEVSKRGGELISEYTTSAKPITIKCHTCKYVWRPKFSSILEGHWCPHCSRRKSEKKLHLILESILPNTEIISQFKGFKWLYNRKTGGTQSIDLWIPSVKLAIEYDGEQHFRAIEFFGGANGLKRTKQRDRLKNKKIAKHSNDIKYFLRIKYNEELSISHITARLIKAGVLI
jgi:hypothetical protein